MIRAADKWKDYELLDATDGERLERWGGFTLVRPDPQAIWKTGRRHPMWDKADAVYHRSDKGGGSWEYKKKLPDEWVISYGALKFRVSPTGFKHTGVFPEQAANWEVYSRLIKNAKREIRVLNMFAYTGGATLACLASGASVCHVDSSKGMTEWAKKNAALSGLSDRPVRYLVDDCVKFAAREIRRGNKYDGIILDPPSYGRGPDGEVWKLEDNIYELMEQCARLLSDEPLFLALNCYTAGISPATARYVVQSVTDSSKGHVESDEIGLPVTQSGLILPCGNTAFYLSNGASIDD